MLVRQTSQPPKTRDELNLLGMWVMVHEAGSLFRACADGNVPDRLRLLNAANELRGMNDVLSEVNHAEIEAKSGRGRRHGSRP